jgi:hypothetical protein
MDIRVLAENHSPGQLRLEEAMNEDKLNMGVRKFLKEVGVTSQREIERAVRAASLAGKLKPGSVLKAKMLLTITEIGLLHDVTGDIEVD